MRGFIAKRDAAQCTGPVRAWRAIAVAQPALMRKISRKSPPLLICNISSARLSMTRRGTDSEMLPQPGPLSAGSGSILKIRLLELAQHLAQFHQHAPHKVFLRLIAQTFADDLVQRLPGLRQ